MKKIVPFLYLMLLSFSLKSQEIVFPHNEKYGFIENKGQWQEEILFKSRFDGGNMWVQQHKFLFHFQDFSELRAQHHKDSKTEAIDPSEMIRQDAIHLNFVGSKTVKTITKGKPSKHYYNYFLGNNKSNWASEAHAYTEATLSDLYQGIDLKIIEQKSQLKYEFHVAPQQNPAQILLHYQGQKRISLRKDGSLLLESSLGQLIEEKPYAYQIINGKIIEVPCQFDLKDEQVRFNLGKYNTNYGLIIDPTLIFATYNGADSDNFGMTATYGHDGTAYSGGMVYGNRFPIPDSSTIDVNTNFTLKKGNYGITDVFITKYSADGTQMLWSTFLGGGNDTIGTETVHSLICDKENNLYLFGVTSSTDFPINGGFQNTMLAGTDVFLTNNGVYCYGGTDLYAAKITSNGKQLVGSTFIGGTANDGINSGPLIFPYSNLGWNYGDEFRGEIMLDKENNILIATCSESKDFPIVNALQSTPKDGLEGMLLKIKNDFSELIFSTYIGGSGNDACYSVKIDSNDFILIAGGTSSPDLPFTPGALYPNALGGVDGFVGKVAPDGQSSIKLSYIGTSVYDQCFFVETDSEGKIYLYGQTLGPDFPVINAAFVNDKSHQFIMRLDSDLTIVEKSTTFGNSATNNTDISPSAFLVDVCGNIYTSGWGRTIKDMPITPDAFQTSPPNGYDFYLMVLKKNFDDLVYATYMGGPQSGEHVDGGTSRFDKDGVVYQSVCGGCGGQSDFPTSPGAWSDTNRSTNCNNLIFKFDFKVYGNADFWVSDTAACAPLTLTFNNVSSQAHEYIWDFGDGTTSTTDFNPTKTYTIPGNYEVILSISDTVCPVRDTMRIDLEITPEISVDLTKDTIMCTPDLIELTANSFGSATYFHWSSNKQFSDTLNGNLADSTFALIPASDTMIYVRSGNPNCSTIDSVNIRVLSLKSEMIGNAKPCKGENLIIQAANTSGIPLTYNWFPSQMIEQQLSPTAIRANTNEPGYIYTLATAANGCTFLDSFYVDVSTIVPGTANAFASDTIVITGTQVTLSATPIGNYTYSWTPTFGVTDPTGQQTTATVTETTTYRVLITDGNCSAWDTVTVFCFSNLCKPPEVFVPNAFSPNDKDRNEILYVRGPHIEEMLFRVYNRWGQMVFESRDKNIGWDGTFNNRKLDPDVYDYYLKVTCIGGLEDIIKGNVTILK